MLCDLCGKSFRCATFKKIESRCLVCKRFFCMECRPFYQSLLCIDHFNVIPKNKQKEFENFSIHIDTHMSHIFGAWLILSCFAVFVLMWLVILFIPFKFFFYSIYILVIICTFSTSIGTVLIIKKKKTKVLKLWRELTGNFDIK